MKRLKLPKKISTAPPNSPSTPHPAPTRIQNPLIAPAPRRCHGFAHAFALRFLPFPGAELMLTVRIYHAGEAWSFVCVSTRLSMRRF
jgi:hypothetical protein